MLKKKKKKKRLFLFTLFSVIFKIDLRNMYSYLNFADKSLTLGYLAVHWWKQNCISFFGYNLAFSIVLDSSLIYWKCRPNIVKMQNLESDCLFIIWFLHCLTVWPWRSDLIFLSLNFSPSVKYEQFSSVAQSCPTLCDPWIAACKASLSITNS